MDFLQLSLEDEIVVDNFAGGGGASTGMEIALGRSVDIAINHDPAAIAMHKANHPNTYHYCENVWDVDPVKACGGRPVALCWFSPDCKHFSKAKGGKPVDKNIRGLAWVAIRWAKEVKPRVIMLENVEEFQTWGPLLNNRPDPAHVGETFHEFIHELEVLGYTVSFRTLISADFGAPTTRERFFLIARRDGNDIVWPQPTYGDPKKNILVKTGKLKPWRGVSEVLDFNVPVPSIFNRKYPLCPKTMQKIAEGYQKFVVDNPRPYIIQYHGGHFRGQQIERPLMTIDASNRYALVVPFMYHFYHTGCGRELDRPLATITSAQHFALVEAFLIEYYGNGLGQDVTRPLHTITTHDRFGLVTIKHQDYVPADIGMRMLLPRELYDAQGFPHNYIIDHDYTGKKIPKVQQVAKVGNSVSPQLPAALVRANLPDICQAHRKHYGLYAADKWA